jgi:hypothetical protein
MTMIMMINNNITAYFFYLGGHVEMGGGGLQQYTVFNCPHFGVREGQP